MEKEIIVFFVVVVFALFSEIMGCKQRKIHMLTIAVVAISNMYYFHDVLPVTRKL